MKINHRSLISLILSILIAGCTPGLRDRTAEPASVTWYDDYFTIENIDAKTIAIGEPRYHQQNYSYLIIGEQRAILFDTGPGVNDIKPVVESLTTLPVTVSQSHLHYDHIGNHDRFSGAALPDLPYLRNRTESGTLSVKSTEFLGFVEGFKAPTLAVAEWWPDNSSIDLGGRTLNIYHAPGHSKGSMILFDKERKLMFSGDFICPGPNLAALPGANLEDYLTTTRRLLDIAPPSTRLLTGHRDEASVKYGAPVLNYSDLVDLEGAIVKIIEGTLEGKGFYINSYRVNDRIELIVDR
jgi:glyoxylase-like metal-dependent hydrolase (beta-lactamase superfamily II)